MNDKRKFKRYECKIKVRFEHSDEMNTPTESISAFKGKGHILDISQGGIFIATDSNVPVSCDIIVSFKTESKIFEEKGFIVRTGTLKNNPAEVIKKFENYDIKEKAYIAVQFDNPIEDIKHMEFHS
ncbi:MAG: PilZ domain-containing protein [Spirochaetes bacterium]|nr:PilZ domain-containing protein [Spirochaetota bacterium]